MKGMEPPHTRSVSVLCSLGLFIAGYIFYSSSLIESFYASEFHLTSWQIGMAQSSVPLGAMLGAVLAGRLADLVGRHRLLVSNFLILVVTAILGALSFDFYSLCLSRIMSGCLAGTLYPLCAAYLTEMTAEASVARQSAILMFINCLAAPVACIVAIILSCLYPEHVLWRMITICYAVPSLAAYLLSKKLPESREWLSAAEEKASCAGSGTNPVPNISVGLKILFSQSYRNVTVCLLGAWFLMDIAYYGINFFVPYLLQVIEIKSFSASFNHQFHSVLSNETIWGTFIINIFFMLGALSAIFIVEKVNLIQLQKYGFLFASISLFLLAGYFYSGLQYNYAVIVLFVVFNFALNLGPDVTTYLLSATSYPVEIRGSGHGMNAGFAKFGSFLGVLLLPRLQDLWGYQFVILLLSMLLFTAYILSIQLAKVLSSDDKMTEAAVIYETN
jgi:MFS family permease